MRVYVIKNEQHRLLPVQEKILKKLFDRFEIIDVPKDGWTLKEMVEISERIAEEGERDDVNVVFVSPVPFLLARLSYLEGEDYVVSVYVFHNDKREKVQLSDGRVVYRVSEDGWVLVDVRTGEVFSAD